MTVAELLGGVAGILFAVIVFGIQFHGDKLDRASFLVRYLRRREGLIPIAAFTLAVVAANAVVSLISMLGVPYATVPLAVLDMPLLVVILWLVLWLIHRMAVSVSENPTKLLTPSLTFEYDLALDDDIHHARQMNAFEQFLAELGMSYSTVAGLSSLDPSVALKIGIRGRGVVKDVNLTDLKLFGEFVKSACPKHEAKLGIGPGDKVDDAFALVLSERRDEQGRRSNDVTAPDQETVRALESRLEKVFRLGTAKNHDVVEVLDRFQAMLVEMARSGSARELDRWLEIQGTLVQRGLSRADVVPSSFSIHREKLPDFLGGFEYYKMAEEGVVSGDQEKVGVLLTFASRTMSAALEHQQQGLYHRAGQIAAAIYNLAIGSGALADHVGKRIDSILHSLGAQFEYYRATLRFQPEVARAQIPILMSDLSWRLQLQKTAIESGRTEDAKNFQHRMFEWDEHLHRRFADPHEERQVAPELREAIDLVSYATLIIAAWSLRLVEQGHPNASTAKAIFQRCANDLGSREHLLRLWEVVRSRPYSGRPFDDLFGVSRWTMEMPTRPGVCVTGFGSDSWVERGFIALMLARPSSGQYDRPSSMQSSPPFRPDPPDQVRKVVDSILSDESLRRELLGIADEKRDATINNVLGLFASRLRLFKLDQLIAVVNCPLREQHRRQLHTDIAKELAKANGFSGTLAMLGGLQNNALAWIQPGIFREYNLQKDSVVRCRDHPMDFAPLMAESIREHEDVRLFHAAEQLAITTATIRKLQKLGTALREAIARIGLKAENPILIYVPQDPRIVQAITGEPGWRLPNRHKFGDNHLGDWEGCHIFSFPYFDPSSVVVIDALGFYGKINEGDTDRLELEMTNPEDEKHKSLLERAKEEVDPEKIPEADSLGILAIIRYSLSVGIHDSGAALRIELDLTKIGYALVKGEGVFHRPDCDLLSTSVGIVHTIARRLSHDDQPRMPCEHCRPDDWNDPFAT